MNEAVPDHLLSTLRLVERAYPNGVPASDYLPLLHLLNEHFSDRNLAVLAGRWCPSSLSCYNDVLKAQQQQQWTDFVLAKLTAAGFANWLKEVES